MGQCTVGYYWDSVRWWENAVLPCEPRWLLWLLSSFQIPGNNGPSCMDRRVAAEKLIFWYYFAKKTYLRFSRKPALNKKSKLFLIEVISIQFYNSNDRSRMLFSNFPQKIQKTWRKNKISHIFQKICNLFAKKYFSPNSNGQVCNMPSVTPVYTIYQNYRDGARIRNICDICSLKGHFSKQKKSISKLPTCVR